MSRYTGPRLRIIRRLGILSGLTSKEIKKREQAPGPNISVPRDNIQEISTIKLYKDRLLEKQKLRFNYGITEKQLISYFYEAKRRRGRTGEILFEIIESRLDCIIFRLGLATTIPTARQLITHGHILVNNKKVNIPSFICKVGDLINFNDKYLSLNTVIQKVRALKEINNVLPSHLSLNKDTLTGKILDIVNINNIVIPEIDEVKIVEYYLR